MLKKKNNYTYDFTIDNEKYEAYFAKDDGIEIYRADDPRHTGFVFENEKQFIVFINSLTDIAKDRQGE